jgi:hypothetical protein
MASTTQSPRILAGFEFELLFPYVEHPNEADPFGPSLPAGTAADPHPSDPRYMVGNTILVDSTLRAEIIRVLIANGIPAVAPRRLIEQPTLEVWQYQTRQLLHKVGIPWNDDLEAESPELQTYLVHKDMTVGADAASSTAYRWLGVEISSRVLEFNQEEFEQIVTLLRALRANFWMAVNSTCGLHVNVSVRGGLTVETMKRTLLAYILVEDLLFDLVAPHRRTKVYSRPLVPYATLFQKSLRTLQQQNAMQKQGNHPDTAAANIPEMIRQDEAYFNQKYGPDFFPRILALWGAHSIDALASMCKSSSGSRIALAPRWHSGHGVLEFRQHEGCVDPGLVLIWTRVCTALVRVGMLPAEEHKQRLTDMLQNMRQRESEPRSVQVDGVLRYLGISEHDRKLFRGKFRYYENVVDQNEGAPTVLPWVSAGQVFVPPLEEEERLFPMEWLVNSQSDTPASAEIARQPEGSESLPPIESETQATEPQG